MKIVATCLAPLSHSSFGPSSGNEILIRRMSLVSASGMPRIPCVSGNALRGKLRRLVMRDLLERVRLSRETLPSPGWDRLYAALANGGHLEGSETRVDPEERRQLRADLPPLSLFGAALYSYLLPGHVNVGILWPRCRETLAAGVVSEAPGLDAEDLVDEVSHVRHVDRDEQSPELSGVTPMPATWETLATGTVLESYVDFAPHATAVERGCFIHGLELLTHLGGKASVGWGRVTLEHDGDEEEHALYREWLGSTTDGALRSLCGAMGPTKAKRKKR